jgi:trk system potassium uptake protein TrkA
MNIIVAGTGRTLYFICRAFSAKGHKVTVIDQDHGECVSLARRLKVTVVHGDPSLPDTLEGAGAASAELVFALTPKDPDNLAICQLARARFGVPRAIAVVNDPDNELAFKKLGIEAFSTTRIMANLIEQRAALDEITNLIPVAEGKVNITEIVLRDTSPVVSKRLREIALPRNTLVACMMREGQPIVPGGETELLAGDQVVLVTIPQNHAAAIRAFTGNGD